MAVNQGERLGARSQVAKDSGVNAGDYTEAAVFGGVDVASQKRAGNKVRKYNHVITVHCTLITVHCTVADSEFAELKFSLIIIT